MLSIFGSLVTAMVTPFDEKGDIDYNQTVKLARYLADNGSTAIVVGGTTGESPVLSTEEKLELFKTVVGAVGDRIKVIAGTGSNDTAASVRLTEQASLCGVHGVMLVTPYYNKPTQEGLFKHFKTIAASTNLPVMVYNVPGRTGVDMSAEIVLRLANSGHICACKEAGGDLEKVAFICRHAPEGFYVYSGDDALTLPMLSVGAAGVVSVASHIVGPAMAAMMEYYFQGRPQEAAREHQRLLPLFRALFMTSNPIPIKAALNMLGLNVGSPRLPLLPLEEAMCNRLYKLLQEYRLIETK